MTNLIKDKILMIWLYLILAILILIVILILSPLRVVIKYNHGGGFKIKIKILGFWFCPYASKSSNGSNEKHKEKGKKKSSGFAQNIVKKRGVLESLKFFSKIFKLASEMLKKAMKATTLNKMNVSLKVGASDAAAAAIKYGQVSALLYPCAGFITLLTKPKKYFINVTPDFLSEKTSADLEFDISARTFYILFIFLVFAKKYSELT